MAASTFTLLPMSTDVTCTSWRLSLVTPWTMPSWIERPALAITNAVDTAAPIATTITVVRPGSRARLATPRLTDA